MSVAVPAVRSEVRPPARVTTGNAAPGPAPLWANAIDWPSGDHTGALRTTSFATSGTGSPPLAGMATIEFTTVRMTVPGACLQQAIRLPSGDQAGAVSRERHWWYG